MAKPRTVAFGSDTLQTIRADIKAEEDATTLFKEIII
jgi:hypothetical protein